MDDWMDGEPWNAEVELEAHVFILINNVPSYISLAISVCKCIHIRYLSWSLHNA